VISSGGRAADS